MPAKKLATTRKYYAQSLINHINSFNTGTLGNWHLTSPSLSEFKHKKPFYHLHLQK
jgi:hypothetical protein